MIKSLSEKLTNLELQLKSKSEEYSKIEKQLRQFKLEQRGDMLKLKQTLRSSEIEVKEYQKLIKELINDYDLPDEIIERIQKILEGLISDPNAQTSLADVSMQSKKYDREEIKNTIDQAKSFGYRANSATVIMMGPQDVEKYIEDKMKQKGITQNAQDSNIIIMNESEFSKRKKNMRYLSNIPEQPMALKSLNTYKKMGRWQLMPEDDPQQENPHQEEYPVDDQYDNNSYLEEEEQEYDDNGEGDYDESYDQNYYNEEHFESPKTKPRKNIHFENIVYSDDDETSFTKQTSGNKISIVNHNKYYKR